jgi:glycosyltransferase AglI
MDNVLLETDLYKRVVFGNAVRYGFISVIIPVYNDPEGLSETLSSLRKQTLDRSKFEIIVVNDGALENVSEVCSEFDVAEVKVSPNRGSYNARNRGLEKSSGEYVAFVDADITVPSHWLERGMDELREADYIGGPVKIDRNRVSTPADYYESITAFRDKRSDADNSHFYVTANLFVKRSVIEVLGGFDQRLRSGGDNEFGRRVNESGRYTQKFSPELSVLHPPRGFRKLVSKRVRIAEGKMMLNRLYPSKYRYRRASIPSLILQILLPPRIGKVRRLYHSDSAFSFVRFYFFVWRFKASVGWKIIRLYPILSSGSQ